MHTFRRLTWTGAACLLMTVALGASAAQSDKNRPRTSLKASPTVSRSPARVVLTAELIGGANDYQEYYCPTVEWDWGDGTQSESTMDCAPYEPGKSEIKRRFTVQRIFKDGNYKVTFRLKRRDRTLTMATVQIQVAPGLGDPNGEDFRI